MDSVRPARNNYKESLDMKIECDVILNGIHIGEHSFVPEKIKDEITEILDETEELKAFRKLIINALQELHKESAQRFFHCNLAYRVCSIKHVYVASEVYVKVYLISVRAGICAECVVFM